VRVEAEDCCDGHRDVGKKRKKSDELQVIREALRGSVFQRILSESMYKPALDPHFASHPKAFKPANQARTVAIANLPTGKSIGHR
jgi:hypothetical protein